ncbi:MAG: class I SAM-dependent methyltransferase [Acidobacteria bacterium]|nr:class I SAM-dependent methyltransferase [Acidobacteriota bacterium]
MDILKHNSEAWDREARAGGEWSVAVSREVIAAAREGVWSVHLTAGKTVPREWFPEMKGLEVLALASGGGQQAPIFAAAGARVTVLDNSAAQLAQDKLVAEREALQIRLEKGDMADLSRFADESFDMVLHPCSNCFAPDVRPVWREAYRVLRRGGALLAGFFNPVFYVVDKELDQQGIIKFRYSLPYSDLTSMSEDERQALIAKDVKPETLEFGHTLDDQIGGQLDAGFLLAGFFEDYWNDAATTLNQFLPVYINTRAVKP